MDKKEAPTTSYIAICSLWNRHQIMAWQVNCNCLEEYKINACDIIPWLKMIWYSIQYTQDITDEMRKKLYVEARKENFNKRVNEYFMQMKKDHVKNKRKDDPLYAILNK